MSSINSANEVYLLFSRTILIVNAYNLCLVTIIGPMEILKSTICSNRLCSITTSEPLVHVAAGKELRYF